MTKMLSSVLTEVQPGSVAFWCPGCNVAHHLLVSGAAAVWGFDGNADAPTFTPSVLIRSGHYVSGQEGKLCWCTYEERTGRKLPAHVGCSVCHSFVVAGRIQFLDDCTHSLAGQTVALPDWPVRHD
jgi:hypothetical protein